VSAFAQDQSHYQPGIRQAALSTPTQPDTRDDLIEQIRQRGIGFPLTDGMRSLVATKSGNDSQLRRTLEEAERRRVTRPRQRFLLKRRTRASRTHAQRHAHGRERDARLPREADHQTLCRLRQHGNWIPQDNLTIAVGYRANVGEEYKVLTVNGMAPPPGEDAEATKDFSKNKYVPKGASSSGVEYISALADVFKPESKTEFRMVDTDVVQTRRTVVYEYVVKKDNSQLTLVLPTRARKRSSVRVAASGSIASWIACCGSNRSRPRFLLTFRSPPRAA
jgi:hypothetical protein